MAESLHILLGTYACLQWPVGLLSPYLDIVTVLPLVLGQAYLSKQYTIEYTCPADF